MNLKTALANAGFMSDRDQHTAKIIPLRSEDEFDPISCTEDIAVLDQQLAKINEQIATEKRNYEETVAVLEMKRQEIQRDLLAKRGEFREWAGPYLGEQHDEQ